MNASTQTQVDVDLLLSQARHHIAAAERHEKKRDEHYMAAGLCLIQARDTVAPDFDPLARTPKAKAIHDLWWSHLDKHEIEPRTAQRLIAEQENPAARRARLEKNAEREAQRRKDAAEARQRRAAREMGDTCVVDPVDNSESPRPRAPVIDIRIQRAASGLTEAQITKVLEFINALRRAQS